MEVVDLTEHLPISPQHLKQIQEATNKDPTLQTLKRQTGQVTRPRYRWK